MVRARASGTFLACADSRKVASISALGALRASVRGPEILCQGVLLLPPHRQRPFQPPRIASMMPGARSASSASCRIRLTWIRSAAAISVTELSIPASSCLCQRQARPERARRSAVRLATVVGRAHRTRRCPQLVVQAVGAVGHRLKRVGAAAKSVAEPGHCLLLLEPVAPRRVLGAADVLDHGEVAQAQDLACAGRCLVAHRRAPPTPMRTPVGATTTYAPRGRSDSMPDRLEASTGSAVHAALSRPAR
jgi:hypothetical protein